MSETPICPVHRDRPMRVGRYPGSFYCDKFIGIGRDGANDKGFCEQRISGQGRPDRSPMLTRPQPIAQPTSSPAPSQTPSQTPDALVTEAMRFAASVFHGTGDEEKALACFARALEIARKG